MSNPQPGWYPDPDQELQQRYWDGTQWTDHRAPSQYLTNDQAQQVRAKGRNRAFIVIGAVAALVVVVMIGSSLTSNDEPSAPTAAQPEASSTELAGPIKAPKFKAKLAGAKVLDPATIRVFISVKNVGDAAGYASCFVMVQNGSGTYQGYDSFDVPDIIRPGKYGGFNGDIVVTNEGAAYVTEHSIECDEQE